MPKDIEEVKAQCIAQASTLLTRVYADYRDKGILSIYLWGSITRQDWNPEVSDIDAIAIVDRSANLDLRSAINQRLKAEFSHDIKLGLQFYGIEELNGGEPYTLLSRYQPAGYLLLRFEDWLFVVGKKYQRSDFAANNLTPAEARVHQLNQALRALKVVSGELPIDNDRHGIRSMLEDVVKGAIGALYWETVEAGHTDKLNYDSLPDIVSTSRKELAAKLILIRRTNAYTPETILQLRTDIEDLK